MNNDTLAHLRSPRPVHLAAFEGLCGWACRLVVCPEFPQTYLYVQMLESDRKIDRQGDLFFLISHIIYDYLVMIYIISHIWWCTHVLKLVCATTVASFSLQPGEGKIPGRHRGRSWESFTGTIGGVAVEIVLGSSTYHMRLGELFRSSVLNWKSYISKMDVKKSYFVAYLLSSYASLFVLILLNAVVSFFLCITIVIQPYDERRYIKHT